MLEISNPGKVRQYFQENYVNPKFIDRDREHEKQMILRGKVSLKLLTGIKSGILDIWNGSLEKNPNGYVRGEIAFKSEPRKENDCPKFRSCETRQTNANFYDLHNFPCADEEIRATLNRSWPEKKNFSPIQLKDVDSRSPSLWPFGFKSSGEDESTIRHVKESNGTYTGEREAFSSFFEDCVIRYYRAYLRGKNCNSSCVDRNIDSLSYRLLDEFHGVTQEPYIAAPLLELFYHLNGYQNEIDAIEYITNWCKIKEHLFSRAGWLDKRRGWHQHLDLEPFLNTLVSANDKDVPYFYYARNHKGFAVEACELNYAQKTLLPITAWTKESLNCRYYFNIPPLNPCLYNSELIKQNKNCTVILTDSIEAALKNCNTESEIIWSSWYGELDAVSHIDWSVLKNRRICYFITEHPGVSIDKAYETALEVQKKLSGIRGVKLDFIERSQTSKNADNEIVYVHYSAQRFYEVAQRELNSENISKSDDFSPKSMLELVRESSSPRNFLLYPILMERSTTLLYAPTNVGKTWFALCVAATIAQKGCIFNKWKAHNSQRVLYVDSEMDEASMQDRIKRVAKMVFDGKKRSQRFQSKLFLISRSRSSGNIEKFKNKILKYVRTHKIKFIVLDNLTAFTQHNDSAKAWEDIHTWVDKLKAAGASSMFIHHSNKAGDQRGTSATTNAVDNVISLEDWEEAMEKEKGKIKNKEEGNEKDRIDKLISMGRSHYPGLRIHLEIEKGRDIFGAARDSIDLAISPNVDPPKCNLINFKNDKSRVADEQPIPQKGIDSEAQNQCSEGRPTGANKHPPRKRRNKNEQKELHTQILDRLTVTKKSIAEIASEFDVSKQMIYNIPGFYQHPAFIEHRKHRKNKKRERNAEIITKLNNGETKKDLAEFFDLTYSSINAIVDEYLIAQIKKSKLKKPEKIAERLKIDRKKASQLIDKISMKKAYERLEKGEKVDLVAHEMNLSIKWVQKTADRIYKKKENEEWRKSEKYKIEKWLDQYLDKETIIQKSALPRRTVLLHIKAYKKSDAYSEKSYHRGIVKERLREGDKTSPND